MDTNSYFTEIEDWRREREDSLRGEQSWFSIIGLYWLHPGENRFGSDPSNDIILPPLPHSQNLGSFALEAGRVVLNLSDGKTVRLNSVPVKGQVRLEPDTSESPDTLTLDDVTMKLIERGGRFGVRLYDKNSPSYRQFNGLNWYPIDETLRVIASFEQYDPPRTISTESLSGDTRYETNPGYVSFELGGRTWRLEAESDDIDQYLFFNFRDSTNGRSTYPGGRFLRTEGVRNSIVAVDFNKTRNPPCAYTPYATCPLPPEANRLGIPIEAGEMSYHG